MNRNKVQQEINKVIEEHHATIGPKRARKQYAPGKKQQQQLEELGILDLMPAGYGFSDADAVIRAATDEGTAVFNAVGEGEEIAASPLNQARKITSMEPETIVLDGDGGSQSPSPYGGYSSGSAIQIWYEEPDDEDKDMEFGWFWCIDGVSADGNYYETDNAGPFETKDAAREDAERYL